MGLSKGLALSAVVLARVTNLKWYRYGDSRRLYGANAFMLWLSGAVSDAMRLGFNVDGFRAAFKGGLPISIVSFALSLMVGGDSRCRER
jgi:hypothetical protein